jgi:ubiquinone/menaquinone biosynthesis C-methylase UbiE
MSSRHDRGWDRIYHRHRTRPEWLPWELGKPRRVLVELVDSERIVPCKTLDLCCGAGTNPIYLAQKGFEVTALDISDGAVKYARERASEFEVAMNFLVGNFLSLPFKSEQFAFAFDFGCFHHVEIEHRMPFIKGVFRVLKTNGTYLLVCFSYKNGPSWNHFREEQIRELFRDYFEIEHIKHFSSLEADQVTRFFYEVLMKRLNAER